MQPIIITKSNLEAEVMKSDKPVLIDFWAPWCGPCRILAPIIDEIAGEIDYARVGKINVDEEPELAAAFGAMSIPLLVVVKDGAVAKQAVGAMPKEEVLGLLKDYV
ncbi:MAG: thioredoxin [Defluviitaleaceae bacterium]|nr:thioredoxin [Defluviitaleaceae bacterium]